MQDHYIQLLSEKIGLRENIMEAQYRQFAKDGGKFILQQIARKNEEKKYEIDRELLVAALFYQEFIKQFIESQDKRTQLFELEKEVTTALPDTIISLAAKDGSQHETLIELQLRWDKELNDGKEEDKRYQTIKQIVLPILQGYVKRITKDNSISSEQKQVILNLTKKI